MASQEERDRIMAEYLSSVQNNDDEDDDEEADFDPEDDDDDDDDDDEAPEEPLTLEGVMTKDGTHVRYKGRTSEGDPFTFSSTKPLHWNPALPLESVPSGDAINNATTTTTTSSTTSSRSILMEGGIGTAKKATVTFLLSHEDRPPVKKPIGKSTGESDEDDGDGELEQPSSGGQQPCKVVATASTFRLTGMLRPTTGNLLCTLVPVERASTTTTATASTTSAAAASAKKNRNDDDDDDDDDDAAADEGIGYDELIALHEDAAMPVEQLRKRTAYRGTDDGDGLKKLKSAPTDEGDDDDDDDDDEFEGF
jgi:hypothetical protein